MCLDKLHLSELAMGIKNLDLQDKQFVETSDDGTAQLRVSESLMMIVLKGEVQVSLASAGPNSKIEFYGSNERASSPEADNR